jgi:hypothetical protein
MAYKRGETIDRPGSIFDESKESIFISKRPKTGVANVDSKMASVRKVLETIYNFNGVKSHKI